MTELSTAMTGGIQQGTPGWHVAPMDGPLRHRGGGSMKKLYGLGRQEPASPVARNVAKSSLGVLTSFMLLFSLRNGSVA